MNTDLMLTLPEVGGAGISVVSSSSAWVFGDWSAIAERTCCDMVVVGLQFQTTYVPASLDTTYEFLFEVGLGRQGEEVTKIQIPYSIRQDTAVGYYLTGSAFLPEGYPVPVLSRVSVRAANSVATALTFGAVRLRYQSLGRVSWRSPVTNNYQFAHSTGLCVGENIR